MRRRNLPAFNAPRDWRRQAEAKIIAELHPGRGQDDPGGLAPLALQLLAREEMDGLLQHLTALNNGRPFTRFDTDDGSGIDIPEILRIAAFWGKYSLRPAAQRPPEYELQRVEEAYNATADPKLRDNCFREVLAWAKILAMPRTSGRQRDVFKREMIMALDSYLGKRFVHCSIEQKSEIIHALLALVRMGIASASVRKSLQRIQQANDERTNLQSEVRRRKAERRTGDVAGRLTT